MITSRSAKLHLCLRCRRILENKRSPSLVQVVHKSNETLSYSKNGYESAAAQLPMGEKRNDHKVLESQKSCQGDKPLYGKSINKKVGSVEQIKGKNGKTANIIVLRDSLLSTYRSKPKHTAPKDASPIDILGQLGNETGLVNTREVNTNINALKPTEEQLDNWDDFNRLVNELANGFTTAQLEQYLENFRNKSNNEDSSENVPYINKDLISSITPWRPDISTSQTYFDNDPYRGYILESRNTKQRLAIRLMRECWDVELLSLMEGVGQFEIQIRAEILEVLLSGKPSLLQNFYDDVLTIDGEGLEVFWSRNVIRITTTRARKYRIVQEVEKLVRNIRIQRVTLSDLLPIHDVKHQSGSGSDNWIRKIFNDQTLAEIKRLTGATVRRETNFQILLGAIKKSNYQEDPVDAARRLLLTARPSNFLIESSLASADKSLAAPLNYCQIDGLNWWCRIRPWYRWTYPILKEAQLSRKVPTNEFSSIHFLYGKSKHKKNKTKVKFPPRMRTAKNSTSDTKWSSEFSTSTYATVGAIVHTHSDPQLQEIPVSESDFKDLITEFSSHVPNVTRLLSLAKFKKTRGYDEEVVLRFLPNPYFKSKAKFRNRKSTSTAILSSSPPVEFHCSIDQDKKAHFDHAYAIVHKNQTDIMLPQEIVDVRFHQRTTSRLLDKELPVIKNFFEQSTLNLNSGGKIHIPPSIILPIPPHLRQNMKPGLSQLPVNPVRQTEKKIDNLSRDVEYLFSGFEIRRRLIFKYESWHLEYIYIDAGKSGGTRGELSLRPIKDNKGVTDQEFINFGLELACRLTSLSSPDLTRIRDISKVRNLVIRKYVPIDESKSDYPRSFLYTPRRIPCDDTILDGENVITEDSSSNDDLLLPDFEEVRAFEDEMDKFGFNLDNEEVFEELGESTTVTEQDNGR